MSIPVKADAPGPAAAKAEPPLRRAPTLYIIIFFKIAKGIFFCACGVALYFHAEHNLPKEWDDLIKQPFVEKVLRIHPENKFFEHIAAQIADVTVPQLHHLAVGTMLFSLFPLVEGIGMLFRAGWAGWLAIGESAFFVPIELYELARKFSIYVLLVMVVNVIIVWYLYAYRVTLFHHHIPKDGRMKAES